MKTVLISKCYSEPHAGWAPIDEIAVYLAWALNAEIFCPEKKGKFDRILGRLINYGVEISGDCLIVIARNPGDLDLIYGIKNVRKSFKRIYAWIFDSYHYMGYSEAAYLYDAIAVTSDKDCDYIVNKFGVNSRVIYQGIDALKFHPRFPSERYIDIFGMGRLPKSTHDLLRNKFHNFDSPGIYLHSPLGNLVGDAVLSERAMLYKILHVTKISLAFHMYCNPEMDRPKSMMVTSRWLESLIAGAIVVGKKPVSKMADDMLCWDDVTFELPDEESDHLPFILSVLNMHRDDAQIIRRRNVINTIKFHDIGLRFLSLFDFFQLELPDTIRQRGVDAELAVSRIDLV